MGRRRKNREQFYRRDTPAAVLPHHGRPLVPSVGMCSTCGKVAYESRGAAKKVSKFNKATGDHPVHPYQCPINPHLWHVGGRWVVR